MRESESSLLEKNKLKKMFETVNPHRELKKKKMCLISGGTESCGVGRVGPYAKKWQ